MASFLGDVYGDAPLWGPDQGASAQAEADAEVLRRIRAAEAARYREESDRTFGLEVDRLKAEREKIAVTRGQAAATEWYNKESVKLAKQKLQEDARQFDLTLGEKTREYDLTFGEGQRQYNATTSGYLDNKPTLAREKFQDDSLRGWTQDAIKLSMQPRDWVALRRMQSGVSNNIDAMPGLNWTTGGQVGTTAFAGQPEANSLQNVMGGLGVNVGQGAPAGQPAAAGGSWASQAAQQANQIASAPLNLNPQEQQLYQTAREFGMNPAQGAAGWYESLDPLTRDLLAGAGQAQGLDWASVESRRRRSQWGGGAGASAA